MKWIITALIILLLYMQYELWLSPGGMKDVFVLKKNLETQIAKNQKLEKRNKALLADVRNLKTGDAAIEERARSELGMIKKQEVFYQVVEPESQVKF